MKQITPYLFFDGKCNEVMNFYQSCLGGELSIQTIGESPMGAQLPAEMKDRVLHAALVVEGQMVLMASDTMEPGQDATMGGGVSVCIQCSTKEEIKSIFARLSEGGKVDHPLEEAFFGMIGNLTDKYGTHWMVELDAEQAK